MSLNNLNLDGHDESVVLLTTSGGRKHFDKDPESEEYFVIIARFAVANQLPGLAQKEDEDKEKIYYKLDYQKIANAFPKTFGELKMHTVREKALHLVRQVIDEKLVPYSHSTKATVPFHDNMLDHSTIVVGKKKELLCEKAIRRV